MPEQRYENVKNMKFNRQEFFNLIPMKKTLYLKNPAHFFRQIQIYPLNTTLFEGANNALENRK